MFSLISKKQRKKSKHEIRQRLLLVVIFTLLVISIARAYSLNRYYLETSQEEISLLQSMTDNRNKLLESILNQSNEVTNIENIVSSKEFQIKLMENYTIEEIYDSIINKKYDPEMSKLIDDVFENKIYNSNRGDSIIIVGTDSDIFWLKSNTLYDKFNYLDTNGNKNISYDEFFESMENSKVVEQAFTDLRLKKTKDVVILRLDGKYTDDRYYTIDDMIDVYNKEGLQGLKGYSILNLATITETGDMFGNSDKDYMNLNDKSKKIYLYQSVELYSVVKEFEASLNNLEKKSSDTINAIDNSREVNMVINIFIIILTIVAIIISMIIYKDLEEDNNKHNKIE